MRPLTFFFLSLFLVRPAGAQIEYGSVGVIHLSNERIVMAADSRATSTVLGLPPSDDECKIATMGGEFISVAVGALRYIKTGPSDKSPEWTSATDLRAVYVKLVASRGKSGVPINAVAKGWGEAIRDRFTAGYNSIPQQVEALASSHTGHLAQAMFGGLDEGGKLALIDVQVTLAPAPGSLPTYHATRVVDCPWNGYCGIGHTDVLPEFARLASPRAVRESATSRPPTSGAGYAARAIRLVELTELYQANPKTVGGPVDAVSLSKNGAVNWLARKAHCPAN
jgi:hypothetical protein